jgi:proline iminopeptidase
MKYRLLFVTLIALLVSGACAQAIDHPPGRYIQLLGKRVWVEERGTGAPLILIPGGGGGSHDYYHPYFVELEKSFHVIYYDGFGRGKSEKAKELTEYTFDHDVDEVEALRKALNLGKTNIFGHSYGGFVAQGYAVKYPESISKLVLANIFVSAADYQASNLHFNLNLAQHFPQLWTKLITLRQKGMVASSPEVQQAYFGSISKMMELFYFYDPTNSAKIVWSEDTFDAATYYQLTGPDADFNVGGDVVKLDFTGKLRSLPFLILGGRADGVVLPALLLHLAAAAPQAKLVFFEKSGHFPFIEENSEFIATLRAFLGQRQPTRSAQ